MGYYSIVVCKPAEGIFWEQVLGVYKYGRRATRAWYEILCLAISGVLHIFDVNLHYELLSSWSVLSQKQRDG